MISSSAAVKRNDAPHQWPNDWRSKRHDGTTTGNKSSEWRCGMESTVHTHLTNLQTKTKRRCASIPTASTYEQTCITHKRLSTSKGYIIVTGTPRDKALRLVLDHCRVRRIQTSLYFRVKQTYTRTNHVNTHIQIHNHTSQTHILNATCMTRASVQVSVMFLKQGRRLLSERILNDIVLGGDWAEWHTPSRTKGQRGGRK